MTAPTSSVAPPLSGGSSSSAPKDPLQAIVEQLLAQMQPSQGAPASSNAFEKYGFHLLSAVVGGLIGWGSAVFMLKDDISKNTANISALKADVTNLQKEITEVKVDTKAISNLSQEIAVIRYRLDNKQQSSPVSTQAVEQKSR